MPVLRIFCWALIFILRNWTKQSFSSRTDHFPIQWFSYYSSYQPDKYQCIYGHWYRIALRNDQLPVINNFTTLPSVAGHSKYRRVYPVLPHHIRTDIIHGALPINLAGVTWDIDKQYSLRFLQGFTFSTTNVATVYTWTAGCRKQSITPFAVHYHKIYYR